MPFLLAATRKQVGGEVAGGTVQSSAAARVALFALLRPVPRSSFLLEVWWLWLAEVEAACGALQAAYARWQLCHSAHGTQATAAAAWLDSLA